MRSVRSFADRSGLLLRGGIGLLGLALVGGLAGCASSGQGNKGEAKMSKEKKKKMMKTLKGMNNSDGYLEAHRDVEEPMGLLGGPVKFTIKQSNGGARVALPDNRELDSDVFGTPKMPLAFTGTPGMSGVPVPFRKTKNGEFTSLKKKTPFGDKNTVMKNGEMLLDATDATATDAANTEDEVRFKASWEDKKGNTYAVRCCGMLVSAGKEFPTFGGVMTNHILHGFTGIGTPLFPSAYTHAAFWGMGKVLKNGEVVDDKRIVHGMLTEYVRTEGYELASDSEVTPQRRHFHLMVAPFKPVKGKHTFKHDNVSTGFTLPNGKELPFWHVMFQNLEIDGYRE